MKPREKAMPTWLQAVMALTCGFIVAGVITTTIFLIINDRTDTQQTGLIHKAFAQITESQRRGCARGNDFRRQSNARVPLERAEANSALIVATLVRRFQLPTPVGLDPSRVRDLVDGVSAVPLTPCKRLYRTPRLPDGVSFAPGDKRP